jgi:hypothetical protein
MFCGKCGNDVGDGTAGFCSRCGAPLATGQTTQQATGQTTQQGGGQTAPQGGPGYGAPPQGGQYGAPPQGGQYGAPPPQAGPYGAAPAGQQYGAPPGGQQQYGAPAGQQYGAPAGGQQQYGAAPGGPQQYGAPPSAPPGQPAPGWSPGPGSGTPAFDFDAKRWTPGDITVGAASLVVLIALFLPWFSASVTGLGSGSESGMDAHGWLWLVFVIVLAILAYLVVKAGFSSLPFTMPFQQELILLAATGLDLLLVLVGFVLKPTAPSVGLSGVTVSIGWDVGSILGLVAAIVAVIPLIPAARNLGSSSRS